LSIELFSTSDNSLPLVEPNHFNWRERLGIGEIQASQLILESECSDCKLELVEGPADNTSESNCSSVSIIGLRCAGCFLFRCSLDKTKKKNASKINKLEFKSLKTK